jgi:hypothetical protein
MQVHISIDTNRGDFEITMTEEEYDEIRFDGKREDQSGDLARLIERAGAAANAAYAGAK